MSRLIGKNLKKVVLSFLNYFPLQIWTLKICNQDIMKSITARSFKLDQQIEDDEYEGVSKSSCTNAISF